MSSVSDDVEHLCSSSKNDLNILRVCSWTVERTIHSGSCYSAANVPHGPVYPRILLGTRSSVDEVVYVVLKVLDACKIELGLFTNTCFCNLAEEGLSILRQIMSFVNVRVGFL